jgi:hypothetical protein
MEPVKRLESTRLDTETMTECKKAGKCGTIQGRIQGKMEEDPPMLIDKHPAEDVFARVPEVAAQTDPVLKQLDVLLDDDKLYQQVRDDLAKRYRWTLVLGRHSTPVEVILRMLLCKHLYQWSDIRDRRAGQGQPGLALVLPGVLRAGAR